MRVNIDEIKDSGLERSWEIPARRSTKPSAATAPATGPPVRCGRRTPGATRPEGPPPREGPPRPGGPVRALPVARPGPVPVDFEISLVPVEESARRRASGHETGEEHTEGSFSPQQVDEEIYKGKVIDIDPLVQEQVVLALPPYPVCRERLQGAMSRVRAEPEREGVRLRPPRARPAMGRAREVPAVVTPRPFTRSEHRGSSQEANEQHAAQPSPRGQLQDHAGQRDPVPEVQGAGDVAPSLRGVRLLQGASGLRGRVEPDGSGHRARRGRCHGGRQRPGRHRAGRD